MKKNRVYGFILFSLAIGMVGYNAFISVTGGTYFNSCQNNSYIEVIDDSRSLIRNSGSYDVLFEKQHNGDNYCYSMTNYETGEIVGKFNSEQNIGMDQNVVKTPQLCAAAWAVVHAVMTGGNVAAALVSVFGVASGIAADGTLIAAISLAIESGGWAAVGAVIGILSASEVAVCILGVGGIA